MDGIGQIKAPQLTTSQIEVGSISESLTPNTDLPQTAKPSVVVDLSRDARQLYIQEMIDSAEPSTIEDYLSSEEIKGLSYSQLLAERDKNFIELESDSFNPHTTYGGSVVGAYSAAGQEIQRLFHEQEKAASSALVSIFEAGEEFDQLLSEQIFESNLTGRYDITLKDGEFVVVGETLSEKERDAIQTLLDNDDFDQGGALKEAIHTYNNEATQLANYLIEDHADFRTGEKDASRARRTEPLTIEEFSTNRRFLEDAQIAKPPPAPVNSPEGLEYRGVGDPVITPLLREYKFL